eukprot:scaffold485837_cov21-Prasinocladus_malaysianus.AAC.1
MLREFLSSTYLLYIFASLEHHSCLSRRADGAVDNRGCLIPRRSRNNSSAYRSRLAGNSRSNGEPKQQEGHETMHSATLSRKIQILSVVAVIRLCPWLLFDSGFIVAQSVVHFYSAICMSAGGPGPAELESPKQQLLLRRCFDRCDMRVISVPLNT